MWTIRAQLITSSGVRVQVRHAPSGGVRRTWGGRVLSLCLLFWARRRATQSPSLRLPPKRCGRT
eukprot:16430871-Heterocapsa_arctica.AAC.1